MHFSFKREVAHAVVNVFMKACPDCGAITGLRLSTEEEPNAQAAQGMDNSADHVAWHRELEQRLKGAERA